MKQKDQQTAPEESNLPPTEENSTSENQEPISNNSEPVQEEDFKDKYLRLYAEFDNYKKRAQKEKYDWMQTAGKSILLNMLEVLDDCERAEAQLHKLPTEEAVQKIKEGVELVFAKLKNKIAQEGVQAVETKGKPFDIDAHEAITEIEAGEDKKGIVVDEFQKGYTLNNKTIRYAKVVVGK